MDYSIIKYFDDLYGFIHFPIQVIRNDGKIAYVNKAFSKVWGYSLSELKEYSIFQDHTLNHNGIQNKIKEAFENSKGTYVENYIDSLLVSKDITVPFFRTRLFYTIIEKESYIVLFHEDQTEVKLAEEEIKKARDGNREAERLKNTFLNVLSHELRTPLNIILGYSSIIRESLKDKIGTEDKVYLDNLYSGSERLFKSITQMLEFAQIEAGSYKLEIEKIDILAILKNSISIIKKESEKKGLNIKTNFKNDKIFVDVDVHSVENAINNLLSNAVKFTNKGFVEVEASIIEERELAICRIKDSGVGISTEYLDHLFRPFSQEDLEIGRNYEGNGLGLALAKRYFEKLGGSLLVDSIKGVGSTFTFTLPLSRKHKRTEAIEQENDDIKLKKVLMLDDSSDSFGLITAFLKKSHVIDVHSLRDFNFEMLGDKDYEAILFDVNQNRWDQSLLVCKDLKKNDSFKRPIIIISSEFSESKINEFYAAGADKFLVKPFTKNDLMKALQEVLN